MLQNNTIGAKVSDTGTPSSGNQGITKVIIANSAVNNQLNVSCANKPSNMTSTVGSQSVLLTSPAKALAFPKNILLGGTQQIIKPAPGTPNKQAFYVLSPVKPAAKITTVIPSLKSPKHRPIAPASNITFSSILASKAIPTSTVTTPAVVPKNITIQQSPTKLILKPMVSTVSAAAPPTTTSAATNSLPVTSVQTTTTASTSQVQVSGNKLHYVRLVSAPTTAASSTAAATKPTVLPARSILTSAQASTPLTTVSSDGHVRFSVSIPNLAGTKQVQNKTVQKILFPAPSMNQVGSGKPNMALQVGQIPPGTLIPLGSGGQGYVVVPANYLGQPQVQTSLAQVVFKSIQNSSIQHTSAGANATSTTTSSSNVQHASVRPITISTSGSGNITSFVPIAPSGSVNMASSVIQQQQQHPSPPVQSQHLPPPYLSEHISACESRPRKPCNCTKSQCLKLYCECFAKGEFCNTCNCINCYNNLTHEVERQKAIKACRDRNPLAFRPKIGKSQGCEQERRHTKGCNCKRSGCLKNYCECYEAKILCTNLCRCFGCKNFEDSSEKKTLLHLADAAEVRVKQQAAAKENLSSQFASISTKLSMGRGRKNGKLPVALINEEVIQKTILCMLTQARAAEEEGMSDIDTEKRILQEFGSCLRTVISLADHAADSESDNELND